MFGDIFSAVKQNNRSRILRHMRMNNKKSTILVKSNGNRFNVLESHYDGNKEKKRRYKRWKS